MTLSDRVAALTGPDRVTDVEIQLALYGDKAFGVIGHWPHLKAGTLSGYINAFRDVINSDDAIDDDSVFRFTYSMDAAMTLVPEGSDFHLSWSRMNCDMGGKNWQAMINKHRSSGRTPALALCAAALRARGL